jgi:YihY family inner membrane protein
LRWTNTSVEGPKPTWTQKGLVLRLRQRWRIAEFAFTGVDNFRRHRTSRHAALLSHYGFLSIFPLLAVMTTIFAFVLQNRPRLQQTIVDSAFKQIPIIGSQIRDHPTEVKGSYLVLFFGLATALWAGTKCFVIAQEAMNDIWEVPQADRPTLAVARGRSLLAVAVIGLAQVAAAIVSGIIGVSGIPWVSRVLLGLATIVLNIAVLAISFRVLTAPRLDRSQILPGAIFAGIVFSFLQTIGGALVSRWLKNASVIYGTFASVIALLAWLSVHAMVALIGVEANAALDAERRNSRTVAYT